MRDERPSRFTAFLLPLTFCVSCAIVGCGSGADEKTVKISPEAEKKTQDMLNSMQEKMRDLHKGAGKVARKGP